MPSASSVGDDEVRPSATSLRADAARNAAQIRGAALAAFRGRGLDTPLEEIAAAAGVSKATVYNRFGGRAGLVDAVIGELVAAELYAIMDRAQRIEDPWAALATYVTDRRDLQYREPAFTDALRMIYSESPQLVAVAEAAQRTTEELLARARRAGVVREDFTVLDLYHADLGTGLALRALPVMPPREDHDRRTRFLLDAMRPR